MDQKYFDQFCLSIIIADRYDYEFLSLINSYQIFNFMCYCIIQICLIRSYRVIYFISIYSTDCFYQLKNYATPPCRKPHPHCAVEITETKFTEFFHYLCIRIQKSYYWIISILDHVRNKFNYLFQRSICDEKISRQNRYKK